MITVYYNKPRYHHYRKQCGITSFRHAVEPDGFERVYLRGETRENLIEQIKGITFYHHHDDKKGESLRFEHLIMVST